MLQRDAGGGCFCILSAQIALALYGGVLPALGSASLIRLRFFATPTVFLFLSLSLSPYVFCAHSVGFKLDGAKSCAAPADWFRWPNKARAFLETSLDRKIMRCVRPRARSACLPFFRVWLFKIQRAFVSRAHCLLNSPAGEAAARSLARRFVRTAKLARGADC
jgi:hypothetical protein